MSGYYRSNYLTGGSAAASIFQHEVNDSNAGHETGSAQQAGLRDTIIRFCTAAMCWYTGEELPEIKIQPPVKPLVETVDKPKK